ncbi:MAG: hypothetical protein DMG30_24950 [Acidobacteria bacterium]|nr:MAG: hypothetical protein DMG30_24950 [Acidobacteriota bacterium]
MYGYRKAFINRIRLMARYPHRLLVITSTPSRVKSPYSHASVDPNRTQFLVAVLAGLQVPFVCSETHELGEDRGFVPVPSSSLPLAGVPRLRPVSCRQRSIEVEGLENAASDSSRTEFLRITALSSQDLVDLRELCGSAYGRSGFCQVTLRPRLRLPFPSCVHTVIQVFPVLYRHARHPRIRLPSTGASLSTWAGKYFVGAKLPATILIVDDHLAARTTIRSLLDWHGFQVCGEARDGKEAIEQVIQLKPDIILLDIHMPVMNGMSAALEIRHIFPQAKILFFTIHEEPALIASLRPYAHGFVSKSAAGTELIPTLSRLAGIPRDGPIKARRATTDRL